MNLPPNNPEDLYFQTSRGQHYERKETSDPDFAYYDYDSSTGDESSSVSIRVGRGVVRRDSTTRSHNQEPDTMALIRHDRNSSSEASQRKPRSRMTGERIRRPYSDSNPRAVPPDPTYDLGLSHDLSDDPTMPPAAEWTHPTVNLGNGVITHLIIAQSIEHHILKSGAERIVLVCPASGGSVATPALSKPNPYKDNQLVWLYVRSCNMISGIKLTL
ncbi:hypothetical protein V8F06_013736 [Rhypophila decipiens]